SAYETNQRTLHLFRTGIRPPVVVVFHANGDVTTGENADAIRSAMQSAAYAAGSMHAGSNTSASPYAGGNANTRGRNVYARTSSYFTTFNPMYVSKDKHTTFEMIYPVGESTFSSTSGAENILSAAKFDLPRGITVNVTGHDPLEEASTHGSGN